MEYFWYRNNMIIKMANHKLEMLIVYQFYFYNFKYKKYIFMVKNFLYFFIVFFKTLLFQFLGLGVNFL